MDTNHKPIIFPRDELLHHDVIEWWYFNGNVKDAHGNEYSFMNCLFRADVKKVNIPFLNKVPFKITYFSHSIISDISGKHTMSRITPFSIISDDSFSKPQLYINYVNLSIKKGYVNCVMEKINETTYHIKNEDINLKMVLAKKPLLVNEIGFFDNHPKKTYYYSFTNLITEGEIKIKDTWIPVTGKSWMDHQWSNAKHAKDTWDWFSIQLNNNTEILCFVYDDGVKKTYLADISYPDDRQEHHEKIEIKKTGRFWTSPKSKAIYPLSYTIKIPEKNIDLTITAVSENREMLFGSINYWEGPICVEGFFENNKVQGVGFMELVGYPSEYNNVSYMKDQIGVAAKQFGLYAKKETFRIARKIKKQIT